MQIKLALLSVNAFPSNLLKLRQIFLCGFWESELLPPLEDAKQIPCAVDDARKLNAPSDRVVENKVVAYGIAAKAGA